MAASTMLCMKYKVADASNQKLRGGYYTPQAIADFLAAWAINEPHEEVLEPSCGDGALLEAAARRLLDLGAGATGVAAQLQGVELYSSEAALSCTRLEALGIASSDSVMVGDFFQYDDQEWGIIGRSFDVVIGNPPFLRYQNFPEDQRLRAFRVMQTAGLNPNRLTNSWLAFLVAASLRLKPRGRLAMVIPAELLQVKYAEETRAFLARHFGAITIVSFRRLVFEGILQEVVLLLAEKSPGIESGIDIIELEHAEDLKNYTVRLRERRQLKQLDHAREKWTQYYLSQKEIQLLREVEAHPLLSRFKQFGCVDVGVVTGNNGFFVVNRAQVERHSLHGFVLPLVGRTVQLPGLTYSQADWSRNQLDDLPCHLLNLPAVSVDQLPAEVCQYVRQGEIDGVHLGYKCSIRKPWHITPSLWIPDAFLFRQIYLYPKLVTNQSGAISTDTIHRVRFNQPEHANLWAASFMNSLSFAFSEVMGRSYGGGVLELEPTEAENLPVPFFADARLPFDVLDALERKRDIEAILDFVDEELLVWRLSLSRSDVMALRGIWRKLCERRMGRGAKSARPKDVVSCAEAR